MSNIVYIGPDKYANLKSDLITKNKVDAVSFEFTSIEKRHEEVFSYDLKVSNKDFESGLDNLHFSSKQTLADKQFFLSTLRKQQPCSAETIQQQIKRIKKDGQQARLFLLFFTFALR